MPTTLSAPCRLDSVSRALTTLLCCGWGYSFAYSFFRCVLDRSGLFVCLAAALPLAAVWAALERKRWGRLVLIGLSMLAQALFSLMVTLLIFSHHQRVFPTEQHLFSCVRYALHLYGETQESAIGVLILSAVTAGWFCMPHVRSEYLQRKKPYLTPGQRIIAVSVVSIWGLTMMATPTLPESRSPDLPFKTPRRLSTRY